ncbi:MAG: putative porin [Vicinamibacterales bacterium]
MHLHLSLSSLSIFRLLWTAVALLSITETSLGAQDTADDESAQQSTTATWPDKLRLSGDFRSRYEGFYKTSRPTRNRTRLRLRLRIDSEINNDTRFQLQVASGDPGTPASTNQTFKGFFQPKPFSLDRAFVAYNPRAAEAITLGIGKFPTPVMRTQMTFDDDLNFEGGWEQFSWKPQENVAIDLVALQTAVNEVSRGADAYMLGGYGAASFTFGSNSLQLSAANYIWRNADQIVAAQASGELTSILTNRVIRNADGIATNFASEFNVVDIIAEATLNTPNPDYPLRLLIDYAVNTKATTDRKGFWIEAGYGDPGPVGSWGATYTSGWIEQDVTPSAFVFSDMPGTNIRLNMIETSYIVKAGLSLDVTLHLTKRLVVAQNDTSNQLLARLHVATVVRF